MSRLTELVDSMLYQIRIMKKLQAMIDLEMEKLAGEVQYKRYKALGLGICRKCNQDVARSLLDSNSLCEGCGNGE